VVELSALFQTRSDLIAVALRHQSIEQAPASGVSPAVMAYAEKRHERHGFQPHQLIDDRATTHSSTLAMSGLCRFRFANHDELPTRVNPVNTIVAIVSIAGKKVINRVKSGCEEGKQA